MTLSQWITANWVAPYILKAEARGEARGRAEGISEGLSQGISEGISQGVAKSNAEWRAWLERKDAAEAQGLVLTNRRRMTGSKGRPPPAPPRQTP